MRQPGTDIFLTSVLAAFNEIHARVGNQRLWIGPNGHYFIYEEHFWPRDPYFEWFGYWLKDEPAALLDEPPIYYSPRSWTGTPTSYKADDWRQADQWPCGAYTEILPMKADCQKRRAESAQGSSLTIRVTLFRLMVAATWR